MRSLMAIVATIILAACQTVGTGLRGNGQGEIQAATAAWAGAYDSRDPARIVSAYAPDAVLWGTSSATIRNGSESVLDYFKDAPKRPNARVRIVSQEIRLLGDSAVSTGSYTFNDVRDGKAVENPARFTFVFRKAEGRWLIVHHHSSRMPSP